MALNSRLVPSARDAPANSELMTLDVKIASSNRLTAILKIATSKERASHVHRTSKPIEVSMSDAELNDGVIRSLVEAAPFLENSAQ